MGEPSWKALNVEGMKKVCSFERHLVIHVSPNDAKIVNWRHVWFGHVPQQPGRVWRKYYG